MLLGSLILNIAAIFVRVITSKSGFPDLSLNLMVLAVQLILFVLMRWVSVLVLSYIWCAYIWVQITQSAALTGGLQNPILNSYVLVILMSGLLIGTRASSLFALMSAFGSTAFYFAAKNGSYFETVGDVTAEITLANYLTNSMLAAWLLWMGDRTLRQALVRLEKSEGALAKTNQQLEHDIAERRRVELALTESEGRFRQIAENMREVFWLVDLVEQRYLYISPSYETIWGRSAEDLYNDLRQFIVTVHPDDREKVLSAAEPAARLIGSYDGEYRIIRPDGSMRWVRTQFMPIKNEHGEIYRLVGISEDITGRKAAEESLVETERLRAALATEHELSELKKRLMRTISHEFRTPLTVIQNSAQMLENYFERMDVDKRRERLQFIQAQVKRLTTILEEMSLIIHETVSSIRFKPETVDLEHLCRMLVAEMQTAVGEDRRLQFKTDGQVNDITADARLLDRALTNLLNNAIKYSGLHSQVSLELSRENGEAVIRVMDEGIGIPLDEQAHIFEPFFRASNVSLVNGTGLGLRIVRDCIAAHGGTVKFDSTPGVGSVFTVRLPMRSGDAAAV
ncbi:MAG: ATP-binding protein [Anaerolineae bacterium]